MKSIRVITCIFCLCAAIALGSSNGSGSTYKTVRAFSSADDSGPSETACMFEDLTGKMVLIHSRGLPVGAVSIELYGTGNENTTGMYLVLASKGPGCPVEYVCHGTFTLGKSLDSDGRRWVDTIVITNSSWIRTPWAVDGYHYTFGTGTIGGAGIGKLIFDSCEYDYIAVLMTKGTCTGVGAQLTNFD